MNTYVVFHKKTGKIVHVHSEGALFGEPRERRPEEVVELSRRGAEEVTPADLDVVQLQQDLLQRVSLEREVYVDIENRVLMDRPTEKGA